MLFTNFLCSTMYIISTGITKRTQPAITIAIDSGFPGPNDILSVPIFR